MKPNRTLTEQEIEQAAMEAAEEYYKADDPRMGGFNPLGDLQSKLRRMAFATAYQKGYTAALSSTVPQEVVDKMAEALEANKDSLEDYLCELNFLSANSDVPEGYKEKAAEIANRISATDTALQSYNSLNNNNHVSQKQKGSAYR